MPFTAIIILKSDQIQGQLFFIRLSQNIYIKIRAKVNIPYNKFFSFRISHFAIIKFRLR